MLTLTPLTLADLYQVIEIEKASRPSPWSKAQFQSEIEWAGGDRAFALRLNGHLIGYAVMWLIAGEIQIQNIVVDPSWRGKKLGEWLLCHLLIHGAEQGAELAILEVRASNEPAIGLYKKYRFEIVGRRSNYYRHGEDALLMTLEPINQAYFDFLIGRQTDLKPLTGTSE